ncbi:MAG: PEP-CTERM sorting domain-containing protein [Rubrivivax sp.]|nr:PEP-CTERM sorting domain-containing protein [Rubrivivax sp.]
MNKLLAPIAAAAAITLLPMASQAALLIQISNGTNTLTVADGSGLDDATDAGVVSYSGSFYGWSLAIGIGSANIDPFDMHLSAIAYGDRTDGKLTIKVTQTDLAAGGDAIRFATFGGGSSNGSGMGVTASWAGYVDDNNAAFGEDSLIFSHNGFNSPGGSQSVALNGTYSATLVAMFDHSNYSRWGNVQSSLDLSMIPEPASLGLLGLGLLGVAGTTRRRKG